MCDIAMRFSMAPTLKLMDDEKKELLETKIVCVLAQL